MNLKNFSLKVLFNKFLTDKEKVKSQNSLKKNFFKYSNILKHFTSFFVFILLIISSLFINSLKSEKEKDLTKMIKWIKRAPIIEKRHTFLKNKFTEVKKKIPSVKKARLSQVENSFINKVKSYCRKRNITIREYTVSENKLSSNLNSFILKIRGIVDVDLLSDLIFSLEKEFNVSVKNYDFRFIGKKNVEFQLEIFYFFLLEQ